MNFSIKKNAWVVKLSFYLTIALIIFDVICDSIIIHSYSVSDLTLFRENLLFVGLLVLQIIISPIQSGLSDFFGRKKSLIVSVFATFLSLIILLFHSLSIFKYFIIFVLATLVKGVFGNTTPMVWSVIADTDSKEERFFFALAECGYAIGYFFVIFMNRTLSITVSIILTVPVIVFVGGFFAKYFKDLKDVSRKNKQLIEHLITEPKLVINDLKEKNLRFLYISFTLLELSLYSILLLGTDFENKKAFIVAIIMMLGYIIGSIVMKFCLAVSNTKMMKFGFLTSIFSLIPYITAFLFLKNDDNILSYLLYFGYFFHAIGNALLSPTTLSLATQGIDDDKKGKRFGLLTSFDTLAMLIAAFVIIKFIQYDLKIYYLVFFSFITIIFAWLFYLGYQKHLKKKQQHLPS